MKFIKIIKVIKTVIFKRHSLRKSGNFRQGEEVSDSDFANFQIYYSYNSQEQNPKFFGLKLYGLGVWTQQNSHLEDQKYSFFTKMGF